MVSWYPYTDDLVFQLWPKGTDHEGYPENFWEFVGELALYGLISIQELIECLVVLLLDTI